ncbi:MAG TPA: hypothetical protein VK709_00845 [Candidatus Saccharimonadales bacterium]|nr:hypothetical protein [Candidatus Saccharimonadales bacterium]
MKLNANLSDIQLILEAMLQDLVFKSFNIEFQQINFLVPASPHLICDRCASNHPRPVAFAYGHLPFTWNFAWLKTQTLALGCQANWIEFNSFYFRIIRVLPDCFESNWRWIKYDNGKPELFD